MEQVNEFRTQMLQWQEEAKQAELKSRLSESELLDDDYVSVDDYDDDNGYKSFDTVALR